MLKMSSNAFEPGGRIPKKYTGEGADVSPPLSWSGVPEGTVELALICDDPDAPRKEPWVHWVLYKISADRSSLHEGRSEPAIDGRNDFGKHGYGGPMPPRGHGVHHYHFRLYALDQPLSINKPGAAKADLLKAMEGHIIAQTELIGTYER
jgi:Raf kinase inhibitor-like YbhB/YbcL family protein